MMTLWPRRMFRGSWSSVTNRGKVAATLGPSATPTTLFKSLPCDVNIQIIGTTDQDSMEELFDLFTLTSVIWRLASEIWITPPVIKENKASNNVIN